MQDVLTALHLPCQAGGHLLPERVLGAVKEVSPNALLTIRSAAARLALNRGIFARLAEWQTRSIQNALPGTASGFEPRDGHKTCRAWSS